MFLVFSRLGEVLGVCNHRTCCNFNDVRCMRRFSRFADSIDTVRFSWTSSLDFVEIAIGSGQLKLMARCKGI